MNRPKPVALTTEEGGVWHPWVNFVLDGSRNPGCVHSIMFDDGSEFDTVNGWRTETLPRAIITLTKHTAKSCQDPTGQRGVTPEMRQAGASVLLELSGVVDSWVLAERVYSAMNTVAEISRRRESHLSEGSANELR